MMYQFANCFKIHMRTMRFNKLKWKCFSLIEYHINQKTFYILFMHAGILHGIRYSFSISILNSIRTSKAFFKIPVKTKTDRAKNSLHLDLGDIKRKFHFIIQGDYNKRKGHNVTKAHNHSEEVVKMEASHCHIIQIIFKVWLRHDDTRICLFTSSN